ncbi:PHP domain-containing protein [Chlorobaculum sp. MV4-Y]|uniref:PHP domain-containing protein n=1 Tax=Chlorobaculum sp. MV4-Y TaxID=2976335 RepID=UPI0021AEEA26|nr:PHP domain-containing protein [Chlorobaculum sp. MV4-Y]UWX57680.1 PHP domain-containing protein [Chlorobaculum sp. MV4-Y]
MQWLYCDFHIHTAWSDGACSIDEVVDLYGEAGFDVIAITDHLLDSESIERYGKPASELSVMDSLEFGAYQEALWGAARRAWERYGMLLIPGVELTNNTKRYHILALDIKELISPDLSVEEIIESIRRQQGISVACHPHFRNHSGEEPSFYLWENHERLASLFDAWEVANRDDLFNVVGLKKFNYIANSDFHERRHLLSWKTLLRCEKNVESVKAAIRKNEQVSLFLYRGGKIRL